MFIDCFENNGGKYLRLARSVRTTKQDGRKTTSKIPVFNIGPLANFDDGEPNYLERLRQSFRDGNPLIPSLLPYVEKVQPKKYHMHQLMKFQDIIWQGMEKYIVKESFHQLIS